MNGRNRRLPSELLEMLLLMRPKAEPFLFEITDHSTLLLMVLFRRLLEIVVAGIGRHRWNFQALTHVTKFTQEHDFGDETCASRKEATGVRHALSFTVVPSDRSAATCVNDFSLEGIRPCITVVAIELLRLRDWILHATWSIEACRWRAETNCLSYRSWDGALVRDQLLSPIGSILRGRDEIV